VRCSVASNALGALCHRLAACREDHFELAQRQRRDLNSGGSRICLTLGGVDFVNGGGGRKSLKVLKVEVEVIFKRVLAVFLLKLCLKLIASEEKK